MGTARTRSVCGALRRGRTAPYASSRGAICSRGRWLGASLSTQSGSARAPGGDGRNGETAIPTPRRLRHRGKPTCDYGHSILGRRHRGHEWPVAGRPADAGSSQACSTNDDCSAVSPEGLARKAGSLNRRGIDHRPGVPGASSSSLGSVFLFTGFTGILLEFTR